MARKSHFYLSKIFGAFFRLNRVLWIAIGMSSCGYHWQSENPEEGLPRVAVAFVSGDEQGILTAEIMSALADAGLARISSQSPQYRLHVSILQQNNETIGFRRDQQKVHAGVKKNLLASEGRRHLETEVIFYRGDTEEIAWGPYYLQADASYDYVDGDSIQDLTFSSPSGGLTPVLPFSLGQLESIESAQEAASVVLYRQLAKKIVDVISLEW